jgi:glycosyltransferase involved in cell wall biosynthesis
MLIKSISWTQAEAQALYDSGHPPVVWWRFIRMIITKLWEDYLRKKCFSMVLLAGFRLFLKHLTHSLFIPASGNFNSAKQMIKKAALYDPYLDTLGGGERYCLTVAQTLLQNGYQVDLFWSGSKELISKAEKRFSLNLAGINIVDDIFKVHPENIDLIEDNPKDYVTSHHLKTNLLSKITNFFKKIKITSQYDLIFFLGDGSIPLLLGKKNLLHVQVPFSTGPDTKTKILNSLKLLTIQNIIVNSKFTESFARFYYGKKGSILYPPVDIDSFKPGPKEKIILSVGRFDNILNSKRQDILIEAFNKISRINPEWKLILAGGSITNESQNNYLNHLKTISKSLPVEFYVNPDFSTLQSLYSKSSIYWHAAGYGVDPQVHPENTEHFGIVIVEAMSAGLVLYVSTTAVFLKLLLIVLMALSGPRKTNLSQKLSC